MILTKADIPCIRRYLRQFAKAGMRFSTKQGYANRLYRDRGGKVPATFYSGRWSIGTKWVIEGPARPAQATNMVKAQPNQTSRDHEAVSIKYSI